MRLLEEIPHITAPRPPGDVMRLARMGCAFATRLSFMRQLLGNLIQQRSELERLRWEMDKQGHGRALYRITLGGYPYSLLVFSHALSDNERTDRVIANAWDSTFVLCDGTPDDTDIQRLQRSVPYQEAGRYTEKELILSRANKSVRLFSHTVEQLSAGRQPDTDMLCKTGYLMRTTAVYGNGKFGIADWQQIATRPCLESPFQLEMLTVWMIRQFSLDLAEHIARSAAPDTFTPLNEHLRRFTGIGNATGLGMAPYLVKHPHLMHQWVAAKETALSDVASNGSFNHKKLERLQMLMEKTDLHLSQWRVDNTEQQNRIYALIQEFRHCRQTLAEWIQAGTLSVQTTLSLAQSSTVECEELMVSLLLETFDEIAEQHMTAMRSDNVPALDPAQSLVDLQALCKAHFSWAIDIDFSRTESQARFWYYSAEKLEPRLGQRYAEPGADCEMPIDIARRIQQLYLDLGRDHQRTTVAEFLYQHPQHRMAIDRVQLASRYPYTEIQDNLIAADCKPIDMLRFKLSFFGACRFDPKSDLWTRITLCQGAPLPHDIVSGAKDESWMPVLDSRYPADEQNVSV